MTPTKKESDSHKSEHTHKTTAHKVHAPHAEEHAKKETKTAAKEAPHGPSGAPANATIAQGEIAFPSELMDAVEELGFVEWTEIQAKSIPIIQQGKDVIGQSFTGSGKTAAFGLPILERIHTGKGIQALILVPTRELCEQVMQEMRKFAKYKKLRIEPVYGGVGIMPQINYLRTADVVVGTPGRVLDHLERGTMHLDKVHTLVMDEADKMFEMGFIEDMKKIISQVPTQRQTLLFSATMPHEIQLLVKRYMKEPVNVKVQTYVDQGKLLQQFYDIAHDHKKKFPLLMHLINTEKFGLTMIFCSTRRMVDSLVFNLKAQGVKCEAIHGGLSQNQRKHALESFHQQHVNFLVASDVAARGLDIKNVSHVINYDLPRTSQEYIHRIGRTARAGSDGKVISILSQPDYGNFKDIQRDKSLVMKEMPLPEFQFLSFERTPRGFRPERPGGGVPFGQRGRGGGGRGRSGFGGGGGFSRGPRERGFAPRGEGRGFPPRSGGEGFSAPQSGEGSPSFSARPPRRFGSGGFSGAARGPREGSFAPRGREGARPGSFQPRPARNPNDITDHPIRKKFGERK